MICSRRTWLLHSDYRAKGSSVGSNAELIPMPITPVIECWLQARAVSARLASKAVHVHALFVALDGQVVYGNT